MTYAELRASLEAQEHGHALMALERIRYRTLESRLARAEATAEEERRRRYEHTLTENDELTRLRSEVVRLRAENDLLRRTALSQAPADRPLQPPASPKARQQQAMRLSAAALGIMRRQAPDPAGFDRTITEEVV